MERDVGSVLDVDGTASRGPWFEIEGLTQFSGQPAMPVDPGLAAMTLAVALAGGRAGAGHESAVIEEVRATWGGDRDRIAAVWAWIPHSRVAVVTPDGALSFHPGTHLQDLAFRLAAYAAVAPVGTEGHEARKRWVAGLIAQATDHTQALRRASQDPGEARAWMAAHQPVSEEVEEELEVPALTARIARVLAHLDGALLERGDQIRAVLLALLAGQHALLLGPPGTAKSLLARALCSAIDGGVYFEYLLSRFTHPDELFGPVSIPGLKDEDYRRLTHGFLPQAHVAFLDEIFKANSAILNSLLTLINERVFHHGKHRDPVPLLGLVGASNELPDADGGLEALYDRFLVRMAVPPLGEAEHFLAMVSGELGDSQVPAEDRLTLEEIAALRQRAREVDLPESVREGLAALWQYGREQGWIVSDRRWRQAVGLLQVAAASDGREQVAPMDLLLLEPCLVHDPSEAPTLREVVLRHLEPAAAPSHDLPVQWVLLWSDRVAPTEEDPLPPGDAPTGWRGRLERRRAAVERFVEHHRAAVAHLAAAREQLEALGRRHLWLRELPPGLLMPHLEAARDLAGWLERVERYRAALSSPESVVEHVIGFLATEERVRPEHMDVVIGVGRGMALGLAYRQWRRIVSRFDGALVVKMDAEQFLDWLDGVRSTDRMLAGVPVKERKILETALPILHQTLAPRRLPAPA
jgi:MoxR-like ATPase